VDPGILKKGVGEPPEIAKKITYFGSQILSFINILWRPLNPPLKDFYDGAFSYSETLSHSVTISKDMSGSEL
jgi:hypothetical protein